jgi:hypothetical protein
MADSDAHRPYNPLEKKHLARSISRAILESEVKPLSETTGLIGAGVYVVYYTGALEWYRSVARANQASKFTQPIYIGKAIPRGGRKGGIGFDSSARGTALRDRLGQHYASVSEATNLEEPEFHYRSLVVDEIWIPLGENMLIEQFKPVWNRVIDGFGNKDPGIRRKDQFRSPWDVLHPGRKFAEKLGQNPWSMDDIVSDLRSYLTTGIVPKRLKAAATRPSDPGHDPDSQVTDLGDEE